MYSKNRSYGLRNKFKGKYFGQKRAPGGENKFNSRKNREEIQFQKKVKN